MLLLPVTVILLAVGTGGFFFIQRHLIQQWTASAQLKLEEAAHEIRMRLDEKIQLIDLIARLESLPNETKSQNFLMDQLREKAGVRSVGIKLGEPERQTSGQTRATSIHNHSGHYSGSSEGALSMEPDFHEQVLKITKVVLGEDEGPPKRLVVKVALDAFLAQIQSIGLWKGSSACLVTADGHYLAHTDHSMHDRKMLGDSGDPLEERVFQALKEQEFGTVFGAGYPPNLVAGFYKVASTDWYVILFSKGSIILEPIIRFVLYYVLAIVGSVTTIFLLIRSVTGSAARSVGQLASAASKVEDGDYTTRMPETRSDEIGSLNRSFNQMMEGLRQRDVIQGIFGRYVDHTVAKEFLERPELLTIGGEERTVTILMADLAGFTQMAEKYPPEDAVLALNRHLSGMIEIISHHKGMIVDFFGAGILAFFNGMTRSTEEHAADSVRCALEMQGRFEKLKSEVVVLQAVGLVVGIHTGRVIVGNVGSETRTKYGIVGSAVNVTERIKSSASAGSILVSEETYQMLEHRLKVGPKVTTMLKGLEHPRDLYPVVSINGDAVNS